MQQKTRFLYPPSKTNRLQKVNNNESLNKENGKTQILRLKERLIPRLIHLEKVKHHPQVGVPKNRENKIRS